MKLYRHYKQKFYKYLGEARHSETEDTLVIYDCLYPNPSGQTWVRPKAMFFETIEHDGKQKPRFELVRLELRMSTSLKDEPSLLSLLGSEPRPASLSSPFPIHLIEALVDGIAIGFCLGYAGTPEVFTNWVGGVETRFQRLGIGQALLAAQEDWCLSQGFKTLQTSCPANSPAQLILNLSRGFVIHGTHTSSAGLAVQMQKKL